MNLELGNHTYKELVSEVNNKIEIFENEIEYTVGNGGNFPTLKEAIDFSVKLRPSSVDPKTKIVLNIISDLTEPGIFIRALNITYIEITTKSIVRRWNPNGNERNLRSLIYVDDGSSIIMRNCNFDIVAPDYRGFIEVAHSNQSWVLGSTINIECNSNIYGGVIVSNDGATINIYNSTINMIIGKTINLDRADATLIGAYNCGTVNFTLGNNNLQLTLGDRTEAIAILKNLLIINAGSSGRIKGRYYNLAVKGNVSLLDTITRVNFFLAYSSGHIEFEGNIDLGGWSPKTHGVINSHNFIVSNRGSEITFICNPGNYDRGNVDHISYYVSRCSRLYINVSSNTDFSTNAKVNSPLNQVTEKGLICLSTSLSD